MKKILAIALLVACSPSCNDHPWVEPTMAFTPKHRIPVHVNSDVVVDQATVLDWVDTAFDSMVANKAQLGIDESGFDMLVLVTSRPIVVFEHVLTAPNGVLDHNVGYLYPDHIDVATISDDPTFNGVSFLLINLWKTMILQGDPL